MANTKQTQQKTIQSSEPIQKKYRVRKDIDPNTIVEVKNGFPGSLVYESRKTGEIFTWDEHGDVLDMELADLKVAKTSNKKFFINNWFIIDDPEILEYLGVSQYYKLALDCKELDDVFTKAPKQIEQIVSKMSKGQKRILAYRSKQMIEDGVIDSIKVINALEKSLSIELIER